MLVFCVNFSCNASQLAQPDSACVSVCISLSQYQAIFSNNFKASDDRMERKIQCSYHGVTIIVSVHYSPILYCEKHAHVALMGWDREGQDPDKILVFMQRLFVYSLSALNHWAREKKTKCEKNILQVQLCDSVIHWLTIIKKILVPYYQKRYYHDHSSSW